MKDCVVPRVWNANGEAVECQDQPPSGMPQCHTEPQIHVANSFWMEQAYQRVRIGQADVLSSHGG